MPTKVHIDRSKLRNEIRAKIGEDNEVPVRTKAVAIEVQTYWRDVAWPASAARGQWPGHPYEDYNYRESIQIRRNRSAETGRYVAGWTVYSDAFNANFIEFGTGPDKPGSRSPWGAITPTPEFHPAASTAIAFGGTSP